MEKQNTNLQGIVWIMLGMFIFSLQNIAIKEINGGYPVLQIVILRSLIALPMTILLFRFEGNRGWPKTEQLGLELTRGFFLFISYNTYFMGVAALPLADVASIRFSAPILITALSVFLLGEKVGIRRWAALLVGFAGVLFIVQPGGANFNLGSVFVFTATVFYAFSTLLTRRLKTTDSGATMAYFSTLAYMVCACLLAPLVIWFGEMPEAHPSIAFLFRAWATPTFFDLAIIFGLGFVWATAMVCVARAYSFAEASVAAPFEYVALPINVMWGFLFWAEIPSRTTWLGAGLMIGSGLYIVYRERQLRGEAGENG